jgi:hypothetical protein
VFTLFLPIFTDMGATAFWALHPQLTSIHTNILQRQLKDFHVYDAIVLIISGSLPSQTRVFREPGAIC